jgi:hypothetical protein
MHYHSVEIRMRHHVVITAGFGRETKNDDVADNYRAKRRMKELNTDFVITREQLLPVDLTKTV